jgi:hypothetical protein
MSIQPQILVSADSFRNRLNINYSVGVETVIAGQGCCGTGVEQLMYFTNTTAFSTAGLNT